MILGIQILGILFALFMMYYTFLNYKRKEIKSAEFSFWAVLWVVFLGVTVFPELLNPIVFSLSLNRTLDFFIILGFMFLIALTYHNYSQVKKNGNKVETIVREMAIKDAKQGKKE